MRRHQRRSGLLGAVVRRRDGSGHAVDAPESEGGDGCQPAHPHPAANAPARGGGRRALSRLSWPAGVAARRGAHVTFGLGRSALKRVPKVNARCEDFRTMSRGYGAGIVRGAPTSTDPGPSDLLGLPISVPPVRAAVCNRAGTTFRPAGGGASRPRTRARRGRRRRRGGRRELRRRPLRGRAVPDQALSSLRSRQRGRRARGGDRVRRQERGRRRSCAGLGRPGWFRQPRRRGRALGHRSP